MLETLFVRQRSRAVETLNRLVPWHRLPTLLGLANLAGLRETLRNENLRSTNDIDGGAAHAPHADAEPELEPPTSEVLRARTADGSYNDLENPRMGMKGMRFGRNIPLGEVLKPSREELMTP